MKILHTSDWHLGHTLYNYDRSSEQQAFLRQLAAIVANEQPDAMVVSGDIYHYSTPSAATQKMYTDGMLAIHQACPGMTIVVTAGNHDSSSKLEIDSNLWNHFGVIVIGGIERTAEGVNLQKHIIEVSDAAGKCRGYVVAVPHVYPQNFPPLSDDTPKEERQSRFFHTLLNEVEQRNHEQQPVVLMAHLSVEGSNREGHDETIGGIDYIPIHTLGENYDYLALGHIHCPQDLKGGDRSARYCGTPLPVSFDERYPHSVSLVELNGHNEKPQIRTLSIENPMPLVTLPAEPIPFEEALQMLEAYPDDACGYIRLNVSITGYLPPDCSERASAAVKSKAVKFCYIKSNRERKTSDRTASALSIQEIQEKSPLEIARLYFLEAEGEEMDEELCELMNTAIGNIRRQADPNNNLNTRPSA